MNIMSAIYSGQSGLLKAKESMDIRASRISQSAFDEDAAEKLPEDIIGMTIDKTAAQANMQTIRVSDQIFQGLLTITKK